MREGRSAAKSRFKRSIVLRWVLSYLAVALIPVILFGFFAGVSSHMLFQSTERSSRMALSWIASSMDDAFLDLDQISQGVLVDPRFQPLGQASSFSEIPTMDRYQASKALQSLAPDDKLAMDAFLFNPALNAYLGVEQWGTLEDLFLRDEFDLEWNRQQFDSVFRALPSGLSVRNVDRSLYGGVVQRRLLLVRPLNYSHTNPFRGWALALLVDAGKMVSEGTFEGQSALVWQDVTGAVLYDFDPQRELPPPSVLEEAGETPLRWHDLIISSRHSADTSLKYVLMVNRKNYYKVLYINAFAALAYLVAVTLFAGVWILSRIRREWGDYEKALRESGTEIDPDHAADSDYLPFVSSVRDLRSQRDQIQTLVKKQTLTLRQHTLNELVEKGGSAMSPEALKECGIDLVGDRYRVVIVVPKEGVSKEWLEQGIVASLQKLGMAPLPFSSDHGAALIVNYRDGQAEPLLALLKKAEGSCVAVSDECTGLEQIGSAYLDAINVLEYEKESGGSELLSPEDVKEMTSQSNFSYTTEDELNLEAALMEGDTLKSRQLVDSLVARNRAEGASPRCLRYLLFSIAATVLRASSKLDERYRGSIPSLTIPPIIMSDSFERSHQDVEQMVQTLCDAVAQAGSQLVDPSRKGYTLYKQALKEIQDHYDDKDLNVSGLADRLGVSIVNLSRAFKKYHAMNISDYIASWRVFVSKRLLSQGMKVEDVASKCGFGSLRTFLRVFKQVEGVTPGEYRRSNGEEIHP